MNVNLLAKFKYCNTLSSSVVIKLFLNMSKFLELLLFRWKNKENYKGQKNTKIGGNPRASCF